MPVTLNLDLLQLNALRSMARNALSDAVENYETYSDDYHYRMVVRAREVYEQVDAAFTEECRKIDEAVAWARNYKQELTDAPF
jgi:hypothetical protein